MEKQMVTIFVSVYNIGEYLERFFDCLDKQTFRNYKLLMIDDGSTDNSLSICRAHAEKDSRIKVVPIEHGGIAKARNLMHGMLDTEFATSLDGDDYFGPDYLKHLMDAQKKYDAEAKKRKAKLLEIALENKNLSVLRNLAPIAITNANIAELIETTQQRNAPDMTAFLLEWQEKHFGQADLEKQQRKEMNRNPLSAGELKKIWGTKKLSDGTLGITSYKGSDIDICIPDCIGKTKITVICSSAFSVFGPLGKTIPEAYTAARKQIRSVIIPDGITSIGFFAFDCCTKMESITIPVTVNAINMAFTHCPNLTIHAPAGSYAEQYANEHNIPFVAE